MINAETGRILRSITPPVFRGDFFDFLDKELPSIAASLIPGSKPQPSPQTAGRSAAPRPPSRTGSAGAILAILPPKFEGHGSTRFAAENGKFKAEIQSLLASDYREISLAAAKPGTREDETALQKKIWRGALSALGVGGVQPNETTVYRIAEEMGADLVLMYQTSTKFSFLSLGREGDYTIFLFDVKARKTSKLSGK